MMKFEVGGDVDKSLVKVIVHEFSRCQLALELFISLRDKKYNNNMITDIKLDLATYNAYSLFIQHLYEYFKGCITRDRADTSSSSPETLDQAINLEVGKILRQWRFMIDKKIAPEWANDRSYYEDSCPNDFGRDFRSVRNNVAHVDYRRVDGGNRITLSNFYLNYHKYIMLLYYSGRDWFGIKTYENLDLGDITEFNKLT